MVECPTCGKVCKNYSGLSTHYGHAHPDEWQDRFEFLVPDGGPDECWEWQGRRVKGGYGQFGYNGVRYYAHRLAYWKEYGPIPKPQINHHCDNQPCVNPNHLYAGTHSDNMKDAYERNPNLRNTILNIGKSPKDIPAMAEKMGNAKSGVESPLSKLTAEEVRDIREYVEEGGVQRRMAEKYSVCPSVISDIVNGERYTDV